MLTTRSRSPLYFPLLMAVCGMLFSAWNAQDSSSVPCFSAGCTLYQSFSFNGFSLWWGGVVSFFLLGILALTGHARLGRLVAGLGLLLDCLLLAIMALTLPCIACMFIAVLLALSYISFRAAVAGGEPRNGGKAALKLVSPLLVFWSLLIIVNIGGLLRSEMEPWAIQSPGTEEDATIRVFFSPSCSACRQLVTGMPESEARKVIWCPVAEEERDLAIILELKKRLAETGMPLNRVFVPALETPALTLSELLDPDVLLTQFRLWCNQARVITASNGRLPLVEFMGVPSALIKSKPVPAAAAPATVPTKPVEPLFGGQSPLPGQTQPDHALPIDMGSAGSCGGPTNVPCP